MFSASNEYELFSIMNYTLFLETTEYVSLAQLQIVKEQISIRYDDIGSSMKKLTILVNPLILITKASHTHSSCCPIDGSTTMRQINLKRILYTRNLRISYLPGSFSDGFKTKVLPHVTATGNIYSEAVRQTFNMKNSFFQELNYWEILELQNALHLCKKVNHKKLLKDNLFNSYHSPKHKFLSLLFF